MKITGETWLRAGMTAVGILLGISGTLGTQKVTGMAAPKGAPDPIEVKVTLADPRSIYLPPPKCPDVYLDGIRVPAHGPRQ